MNRKEKKLFCPLLERSSRLLLCCAGGWIDFYIILVFVTVLMDEIHGGYPRTHGPSRFLNLLLLLDHSHTTGGCRKWRPSSSRCCKLCTRCVGRVPLLFLIEQNWSIGIAGYSSAFFSSAGNAPSKNYF